MTGKSILSGKFNTEDYEIKLPAPSGIFFVKYIALNGLSKVIKFVKF